jgi:lipopolysaccharide/colanic/teichoic acid biosynthesis glycosyltransferase
VAKRAFDVVVAAVALAVAAVPMAVIALAVRLTMGSPVLFAQPRPGRHGQTFVLRKFRTMRDGPEPDAERITRLGRFLRSTSLDELPELVHVLTGEMSLVGPRPLLVQYLDRYTPEQARRHEVRPGLTGLAQVSGRNATTWEARLALDVEYVDTRTFLGDLRIIARTISMVLRREGISADEHATMPEFGVDPPATGSPGGAPGSPPP